MNDNTKPDEFDGDKEVDDEVDSKTNQEKEDEGIISFSDEQSEADEVMEGLEDLDAELDLQENSNEQDPPFDPELLPDGMFDEEDLEEGRQLEEQISTGEFEDNPDFKIFEQMDDETLLVDDKTEKDEDTDGILEELFGDDDDSANQVDDLTVSKEDGRSDILPSEDPVVTALPGDQNEELELDELVEFADAEPQDTSDLDDDEIIELTEEKTDIESDDAIILELTESVPDGIEKNIESQKPSETSAAVKPAIAVTAAATKMSEELSKTEKTKVKPPPDAATDSTQIISLSPLEIEEALERLIKKKFSDKIDIMLVDIIEKTVSVEIERLKKQIIGDGSQS